MSLRSVPVERDVSLTPPLWPEATAAPTAEASPHAGFLDGATVTGEVARDGLSVRIALWIDAAGCVRQARWRAVKEPALRAAAEAACVLLESGADPAGIDAATVRRLAGETRVDLASAEIVVAAVEASARLSVCF